MPDFLRLANALSALDPQESEKKRLWMPCCWPCRGKRWSEMSPGDLKANENRTIRCRCADPADSRALGSHHGKTPGNEQPGGKGANTVVMPDYIQRGDVETLIAIKHFSRTPLTEKFCAVVYREITALDGFVITGYLTWAPSRERKVVWKQ